MKFEEIALEEVPRLVVLHYRVLSDPAKRKVFGNIDHSATAAAICIDLFEDLGDFSKVRYGMAYHWHTLPLLVGPGLKMITEDNDRLTVDEKQLSREQIQLLARKLIAKEILSKEDRQVSTFRNFVSVGEPITFRDFAARQGKAYSTIRDYLEPFFGIISYEPGSRPRLYALRAEWEVAISEAIGLSQ